jgi:hypothetical protein
VWNSQTMLLHTSTICCKTHNPYGSLGSSHWWLTSPRGHTST